jgi:LAO/AO transport system kinase
MSPKNPVSHPENDPKFIGLNVNAGIERPDVVNEDSVKRFLKKSKRPLLSVEDYFNGIRSGNIPMLSQAITLIESKKSDHQKLAQEIIIKCLPFSGKSVRLGITGVPGAGKSTFIEALGKHITQGGGKLAVLAIDPSSERTKGSILADKTRMEELSINPSAYIRPSPSAGSLGGVARKTRETMILCEAAGFDTIFIETVGVGQSETAVHSMVDFFLLIQIAGAGDELQGIKRGIMEMSDAIVINKADGDNIEKSNFAAAQFRNALHLFPPSPSGWAPKVLTCSAKKHTGVPEVWNTIMDYISMTSESHYFEQRRHDQAKYWMYETVNESLKNNFYHNSLVKNKISEYEHLVLSDQLSSFAAAGKLLQAYYQSIGEYHGVKH